MCSGRPPSIMKFSEIISNQSTTGLRVENVVVMRSAQPDADAVVRKSVEAIRWHSNLRVVEKADAKGRKGQ